MNILRELTMVLYNIIDLAFYHNPQPHPSSGAVPAKGRPTRRLFQFSRFVQGHQKIGIHITNSIETTSAGAMPSANQLE